MSAVESCTSIRYSEFKDWSAKAYLDEYYSAVMDDERHALRFLVDSMKDQPIVSRALDIGCGPCVHHALPLVAYAQEIHCADFVRDNRTEVERWIKKDPKAHDWSPFTAEILRLEGREPTAAEIEKREADARRLITRVLPADVRSPDPAGAFMRGYYPLVTAHYCVEAISTDKAVFRSNLKNVATLLSARGTLIISACGAAEFYKVGERYFPCSGVSSHDVMDALMEAGFRDLDIRVRSVPSHTAQGYSSVIFARARKST